MRDRRTCASWFVVMMVAGCVEVGEWDEGAIPVEREGAQPALAATTGDLSGDVVVAGSDDQGAVLLRQTADGSTAWIARAPGALFWSVSTAADGASYVAGRFRDEVVFGAGEPAESTVTQVEPCQPLDEHEDASNGFVARYGADGRLAWVRTMRGRSGVDHVAALADGSVVIAGYNRCEVQLGAGEPGATTLPAGHGFAARYLADGRLAWARATPTGTGGLVADPASPEYVITSHLYASTVFGAGEPNETTIGTDPNRETSAVARYRADGQLRWAHAAHADRGWFVHPTIHPDGSTVVIAKTDYYLFLDDGHILPAGDGAHFLVRYDAAGNVRSVRRGFTRGIPWGTATLPDGSTAVTGFYVGDMVVGPGTPAETTLTADGSTDLFVARFTR